MTSAATQRLKEIAGRSEERIDLAEAALVLAAEEYPGLDVRAYLGRLDDLAATLKARLPRGLSAEELLAELNEFLFEEQGFGPNTDDYYDPRNSFLNEVLDRRVGIPITLCLVYLEVGRRLGLSLVGVSFPGHFLVKCMVSGGTVVIDPYSGGVSLSVEDLRERVKLLRGGEVPSEEQVAGLLGAAGKKDILVRMLRNLKAIYTNREQFERALSCSERILIVMPDASGELRDRAALYLRLECFHAAIADFQRYLEAEPDAADIDEVREQLVELRRNAPRLN